MLSMHGGIGQNGPPLMTDDEIRSVLQATAETRVALLLSDYDAARLAWESISPIAKKVGNSIVKQVDSYDTKYTSTFAVTSALMATGWIGYELGSWNKT